MQDQKPLPPLHRLPNGAHVDLIDITQIVPWVHDYPDYPKTQPIGPTVTVTTKAVGHFLRFASLADAQAYADELAAVVNAARRGAPESRDEPPLSETRGFGE